MNDLNCFLSSFSTFEIVTYTLSIILISVLVILTPSRIKLLKTLFESLKDIVKNKTAIYIFIIILSYLVLCVYFLSSLKIFLCDNYKDIIPLYFVFISYTIKGVSEGSIKPILVSLMKTISIITLIMFLIQTFGTNYFLIILLIILGTLISLIKLNDILLSKTKKFIKYTEWYMFYLIVIILLNGLISYFLGIEKTNIVREIVNFMIPIILSIMFFPCLYTLVLFSELEVLYKMIIYWNKQNSKHSSNYILLMVIYESHLSIKKIKRIKENIANAMLNHNSIDLSLIRSLINS